MEVPLRGFQCDVDNLMVAGRCFAGDHVSHCLTRNIKCCMLTGQAAGAIAAASIGRAATVWNVRAEDVKAEMENAVQFNAGIPGADQFEDHDEFGSALLQYSDDHKVAVYRYLLSKGVSFQPA